MLKGRGGGRDSRGYAIPTAPAFEHEPPEPPDWLSEEALALWRRVAPALDRLDLLKDEDREAFTRDVGDVCEGVEVGSVAWSDL